MTGLTNKSYLDTRRDWIAYAILHSLVDKENVTGSALLKAYRERQDDFFCRQIYKDELYEKFYQLGFKEGMKHEESIASNFESSRAPANPFSRMCGEIAMLAKETTEGRKCRIPLYKKDRGVYTTTPREKINLVYDENAINAIMHPKTPEETIKELLPKLISEAEKAKLFESTLETAHASLISVERINGVCYNSNLLSLGGKKNKWQIDIMVFSANMLNGPIYYFILDENKNVVEKYCENLKTDYLDGQEARKVRVRSKVKA